MLDAGISLDAILYAVLALTIVRIAPVMLALRGTDISPRDALFLGWMGPRGLASLVFGLLAVIGLKGSASGSGRRGDGYHGAPQRDPPWRQRPADRGRVCACRSSDRGLRGRRGGRGGRAAGPISVDVSVGRLYRFTARPGLPRL